MEPRERVGLLRGVPMAADVPAPEQVKFAMEMGNHLVDSPLLQAALNRTVREYLVTIGQPVAHLDALLPAMAPPLGMRHMATTGHVKVFALLIDFPDYQHSNTAAAIQTALFGKPATGKPYESLAQYYARSSYGKLDLSGGITLGWYRSRKPRSAIGQGTADREGLIKEALQYFNALGHDFKVYDNNGDGVIDYFLVFWAGPAGAWATFWWGYFTKFTDPTFTVDGMKLGSYSWQWEAAPVGSVFNPRVAIHETGHALGVPDYYDYDGNVGPDGGLGGADMMDANRYDHNGFSKWMLDWTKPMVVAKDGLSVNLNPSGAAPECVVMWPNLDPSKLDVATINSEFFVLENRQPTGNDSELPDQGLAIWHVDATLDASKQYFKYNNSFTDHKLLRLMEADGHEEIEANRGFGTGDFFHPGQIFNDHSKPNSRKYDGTPTCIEVCDIVASRAKMGALIKVGATLDQINNPVWTSGGAVNIVPVNKVSQTFVPKVAHLTAVEIGLMTGNTGHGGDNVTLNVLDEDQHVLGTVSAKVREGFSGFLHFDMPAGGINVIPGHTYTLRVQDTGKVVFWWKYVHKNPYANGQAYFYGHTFADNDFFFKTFGMN
jgi:M6 family metalloprotease-like protein